MELGEQQNNESSKGLPESEKPLLSQPEPMGPGIPQNESSLQQQKKSKKKIFIVVLFLLLVLGAGAWFVLIGDDSAEESSNTTPNNSESSEQQSAFEPTYFVQTGPIVEYINGSGSLETFTNLANNEVVTDVRIINGESRVYYYTTQPDDFYGVVITGYGYAVGDKKSEVASFSQTGLTYYSSPVLSPDASKIVMEGGYDGNGVMGDIYLYDTASGEGEVVYETVKTQDDSKDLFIIVGWLDNSTVLVQEQTCRECDGPRKAVLHKMDIASGSLTPFFNENDSIDTLGWATFFIDNGKVYVFGGDYGKVFAGEEQDFAPDELHEVDVQTGEPRLIATFDDEIVQIANIDKGKMYITLRNLIPSDATDAPYQSIDGNKDFSQGELIAVDLNDGSVKPVSIETKYFINSSYAETVHQTDTGLFILTNTSFSEIIDGATYSGGEYALFELPNTTESTELKLIKEHKTLFDDNATYLSFFVAQ